MSELNVTLIFGRYLMRKLTVAAVAVAGLGIASAAYADAVATEVDAGTTNVGVQ